MSKVFYVCFYADPEVQNQIITYPSVWSKIDYVVDAIKKNGKEVIVFSIAPALKNKFTGYEKEIDSAEKHIYISSRSSSNKVVHSFLFVWQNVKIISYLLRNVKKDDKVLVYHSLYNRIWLPIYAMLFPKKVILEIEDVFSALSQKTAHFWVKEWSIFRHMQRCICVNDILYQELEDVPQKMVSYGSYNIPPRYAKNTSGKIRLVYAGVVEQERNAAFLAVQSMLYLSDVYELHILGFGNDNDVEALKRLIDSVNEKKNTDCVCYHNRMNNEEYWKFLQSCDIALSTHSYTAENYKSSLYTFPSKILTYLANDLRVVAQRLEVLEQSQVCPYIWFYDEPTPEALAQAICSIDISEQYDSRSFISQIDKQFRIDLQSIMDD